MTNKPCWGVDDAPNVDMTQYSSTGQMADELASSLPLGMVPDVGQSDSEKAAPLVFAAAQFLGYIFTEVCNPDFLTQQQAATEQHRQHPHEPFPGISPILRVLDASKVPDFLDGVNNMTPANWTDAWAQLKSAGKGGKIVIDNGQGA